MDAKEHSWEGDYADFDQRSRIITQLSLFLSVLFPVVRTENRESSALCVVTSRKWVRARFPDLGATFFRLRIRIAKLSWKERDNNHTEGKIEMANHAFGIMLFLKRKEVSLMTKLVRLSGLSYAGRKRPFACRPNLDRVAFPISAAVFPGSRDGEGDFLRYVSCIEKISGFNMHNTFENRLVYIS